ncbi:MAG: hypothetical protein RL637_345 [Pseudomonadota bacterium]|jgi:hypothetical protein
MINYSEITRYQSDDFGAYLKAPGYSHSYLKQEINGILPEFNVTENVRIGKIVDAIITGEPVNMSDELYPYCRDIAGAIKANYGSLIDAFEKQVNYMGKAEYNRFTMPVKGRLDFLLPKNAAIDLKVTKSKDIKSLIKYMGYENQLWNYCKLAGVKKAFLMVYSIPLKKTQLIQLDCSNTYNEFWAEKILKFGKIEPASV